MFFIRKLRPTLNVQSDSIRAKFFSVSLLILFSLHVFIVRLHLQKLFYFLLMRIYVFLFFYLIFT